MVWLYVTTAFRTLSHYLFPVGWGVEQGVGGFGDDPGVKAQLLHLIRSVRTVMRGWTNLFFFFNPNKDWFHKLRCKFVCSCIIFWRKYLRSVVRTVSQLVFFLCFYSAFNISELCMHRPVVAVWMTVDRGCFMPED